MLDADLRRAINRQFSIDVEVASAFNRAVVNREMYYTSSYRRTKTRNSFTAEYLDGNSSKFGFINQFISLKSFTVAVLTPLIPTSLFCYPASLGVLCKRIVPVSVESSFVLVPAQSLVCKCVYIDLCGGAYVARLPCTLYAD